MEKTVRQCIVHYDSINIKEPLRVVTDVPLRAVTDVPLRAVTDVPLRVVTDVPLRAVTDVPLRAVTDVSLKSLRKIKKFVKILTMIILIMNSVLVLLQPSRMLQKIYLCENIS